MSARCFIDGCPNDAVLVVHTYPDDTRLCGDHRSLYDAEEDGGDRCTGAFHPGSYLPVHDPNIPTVEVAPSDLRPGMRLGDDPRPLDLVTTVRHGDVTTTWAGRSDGDQRTCRKGCVDGECTFIVRTGDCVEPGCAAELPGDPNRSRYRRAREHGWARVYALADVPDGFRCPEHRRQNHQGRS